MATKGTLFTLVCLLVLVPRWGASQGRDKDPFSRVVKEVRKISRSLAEAADNPDAYVNSRDLWGIAEKIEAKLDDSYTKLFELSADVAALKKKYINSTDCPYPFEWTEGRNCLWASPKSLKSSYYEARTDCWAAGGDLAHPEDLNDLNQFIEKKFSDQNRYVAVFFVGAVNLGTKEVVDFRWFDGRMVRPTSNRWSELMHSGDCVIFRKGGDISSTFCDKRRYLCQKPITQGRGE